LRRSLLVLWARLWASDIWLYIKRGQILGIHPPPVCWWMTAAIAYILTARVGVNFLSTYIYLEYTDSSAISNVPLLPSSTLHHLW
ncbi:MAG: hypothetical protein QW429_03475, partial [Thermoprotei archaeon]